jgi:hypothetical protein
VLQGTPQTTTLNPQTHQVFHTLVHIAKLLSSRFK